jgi:TonB family protein
MSRSLLVKACFGLVCLSSCGGHVSAQTQADGTKEAARAIYSEIAKLPVHAVCVRDFVDGEGKPSVFGQSVAASFSKWLSEQRGPVSIASRARLRIIEDRYKWSGLDLADSAYAEKFSAEMGVEGFLQGQISEAQGDYRVTVTLRNSVGHELLQRSFSKKNDSYAKAIRAVPSEEFGSHPNFAGQDGMQTPKCKRCPNPDYTETARAARVEGDQLFLVRIMPNGKITFIQPVQGLDAGLDQNAMKALQRWTMEPAKDLEGSAVPVWVNIEISFRLYDRR